jgi:1,4-dihydroxy-2-naphthoate octaprenyltransferase
LLLHAGANLINDYFDHKNKSDEINREFVRPFTGGSRFIQNQILSPGQVLTAAILCLAAGSAIGIYLTIYLGVVILLLGLAGVLSAIFYTAPPVYLAKREIGEILVGINFGILMTMGAYYVQVQKVNWEVFVASLPVAALIATVLYMNEFQDCNADREAGKAHLIVRWGKQKAVRGYIVFIVATYILILAGVAARAITPWALLGLVTLPISMKAIMVVRANYNKTKELAPANAMTIVVHLLTGLLLIGGFIISFVS